MFKLHHFPTNKLKIKQGWDRDLKKKKHAKYAKPTKEKKVFTTYNLLLLLTHYRASIEQDLIPWWDIHVYSSRKHAVE